MKDFHSEFVSVKMNTENKENVSQANVQIDKESQDLKTDEIKTKIDAAFALGKRAIIGKVQKRHRPLQNPAFENFGKIAKKSRKI